MDKKKLGYEKRKLKRIIDKLCRFDEALEIDALYYEAVLGLNELYRRRRDIIQKNEWQS